MAKKTFRVYFPSNGRPFTIDVTGAVRPEQALLHVLNFPGFAKAYETEHGPVPVNEQQAHKASNLMVTKVANES